MTWGKKPETVRELRAALVGDSIERQRLMEKLVKAIRKDERESVLRVMGTRDPRTDRRG